METGESEADRPGFGYAGTALLAILAIFGGLFLAGAIREVARIRGRRRRPPAS